MAAEVWVNGQPCGPAPARVCARRIDLPLRVRVRHPGFTDWANFVDYPGWFARDTIGMVVKLEPGTMIEEKMLRDDQVTGRLARTRFVDKDTPPSGYRPIWLAEYRAWVPGAPARRHR